MEENSSILRNRDSHRTTRGSREIVLCGHCDCQLPKSTFYRHYWEFYDSTSKSWRRLWTNDDLRSSLSESTMNCTPPTPRSGSASDEGKCTLLSLVSLGKNHHLSIPIVLKIIPLNYQCIPIPIRAKLVSIHLIKAHCGMTIICQMGPSSQRTMCDFAYTTKHNAWAMTVCLW